ncbi:MAG: hypothetical protein LBS42_00970 [Tannerella sp.]|nr:hypothetical protein [Tannerella sp.]
MRTENKNVSFLTEWSRKIKPTKTQLVVICLAGVIYQLMLMFPVLYFLFIK